MKKPRNLNPEDALNAILSDVVADQVRRALELGYEAEDVRNAVQVGLRNGEAESQEARDASADFAKKTRRIIRQQARGIQ